MVRYKQDALTVGSVLGLDDDDGMVEVFMVREGESLPPPVTKYPNGEHTVNLSDMDDDMRTPPSPKGRRGPPPRPTPVPTVTAHRPATQRQPPLLTHQPGVAPSDFSVFHPNESYNPNLHDIPSPHDAPREVLREVPEAPLVQDVTPPPPKRYGTRTASTKVVVVPPEPLTDYSGVECMCPECVAIGAGPAQASEPESSLRVSDYPAEEQYMDDLHAVREAHARRHRHSEPTLKQQFQPQGYPRWKMMGAYRKGLPHDRNGIVSSKQFQRLVLALQEHDEDRLATVKVTAPLNNASTGWSHTLIGAPLSSFEYHTLPSFRSDTMAPYMAELYAMALTRDVPFRAYATDPGVQLMCGHLNELELFPQVRGKITPYNIFRGTMAGDVVGPYISQFLYVDVPGPYGPQPQQYPAPSPTNYLTTWEEAVVAQRGVADPITIPLEAARYIMTGRDLASYVRLHLLEPYANTHRILQGIGAPHNQGLGRAYPDWDITTTLSEVGRTAMLAAWSSKWRSLNLCPEAYAIEVERVFRAQKNYFGVPDVLLNSGIVHYLQNTTGSHVLSQASPGGAPHYPSVPSLHATVAGASITVIKFFYDVDSVIAMVAPTPDGTTLVDTGLTTTIGYELDKLASNIGAARSWEGANYHAGTIAGLKLGEAVALSCLSDLIHRYRQPLTVTLPKFSGRMVTVSNK